jgi:hypothetical protein
MMQRVSVGFYRSARTDWNARQGEVGVVQHLDLVEAGCWWLAGGMGSRARRALMGKR